MTRTTTSSATCPVRDYRTLGATTPAGTAFEQMDAHRAAARPALWTTEGPGYWVFTDHDAVVDGLRDWQLWASDLAFPIDPAPEPRLIPIMLAGAEHTRWRRLLASWFTPARIRSLLAGQERLAAGIIDDVLARGGCDFATDVAQVFPSTVFLQMMGMPLDGLPQLLDQVDRLMHLDTARDDAQQERFRAIGEMAAHFAGLIAARRADPDPLARDIVSHAVTWEIDGEPIPAEDLVNCFITLVGAALDTVAGTAGYGLLHLAERPELRHRLTAEPSLWPKAVDEILRIYPIAQLTRVATRDAEFHGCPVRAGDVAVFPLSSAGRDEHAHPDPLEIDLARRGPHLASFGAGPHFCVGAHLARQELAVLFEQWHRRIPDYEVVGTPLEASGGIWGVRSLRLRWER